MADISIPVSVSVKLPEGLKASDFDRKVMMKALTEAGKKIQLTSKRLLNTKGTPSKAGELPKRVTGRMWRHVKLHKAKRKDRYWVRVQIDSFNDVPMWYPAALMYGSTKRKLQPRKDAIWQAHASTEAQTTNLIELALGKAIKGWF